MFYDFVYPYLGAPNFAPLMTRIFNLKVGGGGCLPLEQTSLVKIWHIVVRAYYLGTYGCQDPKKMSFV